jgi:hypothetical protein
VRSITNSKGQVDAGEEGRVIRGSNGRRQRRGDDLASYVEVEAAIVDQEPTVD